MYVNVNINKKVTFRLSSDTIFLNIDGSVEPPLVSVALGLRKRNKHNI